MRKQFFLIIILLLPALLFFSCSFSQQKELTFSKNIPPFNLVLSDGVTSFNASNLQKNKGVIIIYFDPDCDHCKQYIRSITKNIQPFKNTQIIMICNTGSISAVKKFAADNALNKFPVIKVGTEGIYHATMNFYHVAITPFTALYNNKGLLIGYYRNMPSISDLVKALSLM